VFQYSNTCKFGIRTDIPLIYFDCTNVNKAFRGPSKGYFEALEARILETESLLLQIVPLISSDQLARAAAKVQERQRSRTTPYPGNEDSAGRIQSSLAGKFGVDYWAAFPLRTGDDIRVWVNDHASCQEDSRILDAVNAQFDGRENLNADITQGCNTNSHTMVEVDITPADSSEPSILSLNPEMSSRAQISESRNLSDVELGVVHPGVAFVPNVDFAAHSISSVNNRQQPQESPKRPLNHTPTTSESTKKKQIFLPDQFVQEFIW
jgi:hypothetical protein